MNHLGKKQTLLDPFFEEFDTHTPLLMLDYDGTLAPFHQIPSQASPYPGVAEKIQTIINRNHTEVVMISGRELNELKELIPLNPYPELWGCHGWEWMTKEGAYHSHSLNHNMKEGFKLALTLLENSQFKEKVEIKPFGLALHWRGESALAKQEMEAEFIPAWTQIASAHELEIHPFSEGLEIRPIGRHKGEVVNELLALHKTPRAAYLGDDFTDEDAFRALKGKGLTILVRNEWRPTEAEMHIVPPHELLLFLDMWIEAERRAV